MTEQLVDKKCIPCTGRAPALKTLDSLEQSLIAAARGPSFKLNLIEVRKKGLIAVLREQVRRR